MQSEATVFLVDDDPAALDSLAWLMKAAGLNVEAYTSAVDYLAAHDPQKPGCLVLDICMPEMNGLELQEKLIALGQSIPIIFVSAHADVPSSVRAMKAHAIDFLEKPADGELLLEAVRRALEKDSCARSQGPDRAEIGRRIEQLTPREREVMELLYACKPMKIIAAELGISKQTVAKHRAQMLQKMEVEGDAQLVRILTTYRRQEPQAR